MSWRFRDGQLLLRDGKAAADGACCTCGADDPGGCTCPATIASAYLVAFHLKVTDGANGVVCDQDVAVVVTQDFPGLCNFSSARTPTGCTMGPGGYAIEVVATLYIGTFGADGCCWSIRLDATAALQEQISCPRGTSPVRAYADMFYAFPELGVLVEFTGITVS